MWFCLLASHLLASTYVFSLYLWRDKLALDRDDPKVIKRRFISALGTTLVAPPFVYLCADASLLGGEGGHSLWQVVGIKWAGMIPALIVPLMLTAVLFLGPLVAGALANDGRFQLWRMPLYWETKLTDLIWWRNFVVAPITEEFTFRACMLPILLGCFSYTAAIVIAPLFFGVAHIHHVYERVTRGVPVKDAVLISLFQAAYTTVFGMYSAFLFIRTGHLAAPAVVHGFCNVMGFPDIGEVFHHTGNKRNFLIAMYLLGVFLFYQLLFPLTEPVLYANSVYNYEW